MLKKIKPKQSIKNYKKMKSIKFLFQALFIIGLLASCEKDHIADQQIESTAIDKLDINQDNQSSAKLNGHPPSFDITLTGTSGANVTRRYGHLIRRVRQFMGNGTWLANNVLEMRAPRDNVYRIRVIAGARFTDYYFSTLNMYLIGVGYRQHPNNRGNYIYRRLLTNNDATTFEGRYRPAVANVVYTLPFAGDYPALERTAGIARRNLPLYDGNIATIAGVRPNGAIVWQEGNLREEARVIMRAALLFAEGARFDPVGSWGYDNFRRAGGQYVRFGDSNTALTNNWARITRELRHRLRSPRGHNDFRVGNYRFAPGNFQQFGRVLAIGLRPVSRTGRHH